MANAQGRSTHVGPVKLPSRVNPRTGATWRLSDEVVASNVTRLEQSLSDPATALRYLVDNGFMTPSGKTPKKYGG